jgi:hypothetical protein
VVKVLVKVFCVVMPCSDVVGYRCFKGPCRLHLQGAMKTALSSKTLVSYCNTMWHHNPEDLDMSPIQVPMAEKISKEHSQTTVNRSTISH